MGRFKASYISLTLYLVLCLSGGAAQEGTPKKPPPFPKLPLEPEMVMVPEGDFLMGSTSKQASCNPPKRVWLKAYRIGKYEVTAQQYLQFCATTHRAEPLEPSYNAYWRRERERTPIANVSWEDANAYCYWLSKRTKKCYRLPTAAEWEKAARGTDGRNYPWGSEWDNHRCANSQDTNRPKMPSLVGSFPKGVSPYGAYDMAGNLAEWCSDPFPASPKQNTTSTERVVRGGAWLDGEMSLFHCANITHFPARTKHDAIGFRLVLHPEQQDESP